MSPRRLVRGVILAGLVVWVVSTAVECGRAYSLDGSRGCVAPLLFKTDTEYAAGYSQAAFRRVGVGMTTEEVIALLGPPIRVWPRTETGSESWAWSRSPGGHSYRIRVVSWERERVTGVFHEFYVD